MKYWLCLLCCLLGPVPDSEEQGGCLQTLPADGVWVDYHVSIQVASKETQATWKARSVGQITFENVTCRWIELEQSSESNEFPSMTWRLLIPEKEFGAGTHPLEKAKKVWRILKDQPPEVVESLESADPIFFALTRGPVRELKTDQTQSIAWQRGDLPCGVVAGISEIRLNEGVPLPVKQKVFRNRHVPFGFAGFEVEIGQGPLVRVRMTLKDHGNDAKPQYPDQGV